MRANRPGYRKYTRIAMAMLYKKKCIKCPNKDHYRLNMRIGYKSDFKNIYKQL
jgi:hypothetical protein